MSNFEVMRVNIIKKRESRAPYDKNNTGKILHLDGDRRYSEKAYKYYKKMKLNAVVKNVAEYRQPKNV